MPAEPKRFVYILKSVIEPFTYYVGVTSDPRLRLQAHNAGWSPHTARHRPWRQLVVIEFDEEAPALQFERYLKTGSGQLCGSSLDMGSSVPFAPALAMAPIISQLILSGS